MLICVFQNFAMKSYQCGLFKKDLVLRLENSLASG
jgi:hypothetical protein